jgi:hypothetical protein
MGSKKKNENLDQNLQKVTEDLNRGFKESVNLNVSIFEKEKESLNNFLVENSSNSLRSISKINLLQTQLDNGNNRILHNISENKILIEGFSNLFPILDESISLLLNNTTALERSIDDYNLNSQKNFNEIRDLNNLNHKELLESIRVKTSCIETNSIRMNSVLLDRLNSIDLRTTSNIEKINEVKKLSLDRDLSLSELKDSSLSFFNVFNNMKSAFIYTIGGVSILTASYFLIKNTGFLFNPSPEIQNTIKIKHINPIFKFLEGLILIENEISGTDSEIVNFLKKKND